MRQLLDKVGDDLWWVDEAGRDVPTILVARDGSVVIIERPRSTLGGQYLRTVAALAERGFSTGQIAELYPREDRVALEEALELERSLAA